VRRMRVAILTHRDLVPPDDVVELSDKAFHHCKREWGVAEGLKVLGHDVRFLGVEDDLMPIRRLVEEWKPQIVFNLLMEFQDVGLYQVHVTSYLELLGVPFTGCNSRGILLARDKAVAKKILRYHRIPTPAFATFPPGRAFRPPRRVRYPLIVKSVQEEASFAISQASVVRNADQLAERVEFVHRHTGEDAIAEEYVEGREFTISVLGNRRLQTLPIWELLFESLPEGTLPIATERVKWDLAYQRKIGVDSGPARELPEGMPERIARLARRIYRIFGMSGYARIDLRFDAEGQVWVIEANATPDITYDEDLALSARAAGLDYEALLRRILRLALRYRPAWKES
jgi:D-alanine-D-alanine ligase